MKSTGLVRRVDDLGRIVLPVEIRRGFGIVQRDELEIYVDNDRIVLEKFEPKCIFCGSSDIFVDYMGKNVCRVCAQRLGSADELAP